MADDRLALLLSTLAFLGAVAAALGSLLSGPWRSQWWHTGLMALGFIGQCWFLAIRGQAVQRCPVTSLWEVLVFVSWGIVLAYWITGPAFRLSLLGVFTAPMVWLLQLGALITHGNAPAASVFRDGPLDRWLEWHATVSLLAYALFALAATAGVMFVLQDRQLKKQRLSPLFYHLPPLTNLVKALRRLLAGGFLLLSMGVATAYLMEKSPTPLKLSLSWFIWAAYLTVLLIQWRRGWSGRKLAWVAVGLFALPLLSLAVMNHH
jgi:HemX protein